MIYLCINLYKSVTKVGIYFLFCKKFLIFFSKNCFFLPIRGRAAPICPILSSNIYFFSVRLTGLEPARRETPDPKSDASTNSATGACFFISFLRFYTFRVQR